jgi:hypothetical protein
MDAQAVLATQPGIMENSPGSNRVNSKAVDSGKAESMHDAPRFDPLFALAPNPLCLATPTDAPRINKTWGRLSVTVSAPPDPCLYSLRGVRKIIDVKKTTMEIIQHDR